jgi:two-component system response regulator PilR (NtrC family)
MGNRIPDDRGPSMIQVNPPDNPGKSSCVGDTQTFAVDVRLISATNKDLEQEIIQGRFREDLFFRLNVVRFHLPPLRERREDIPLLAQYFLEKYSRELGKNVHGISSYALEQLEKYDFPGNIRELENIIERSVPEIPTLFFPTAVLAEPKKAEKQIFLLWLTMAAWT